MSAWLQQNPESSNVAHHRTLLGGGGGDGADGTRGGEGAGWAGMGAGRLATSYPNPAKTPPTDARTEGASNTGGRGSTAITGWGGPWTPAAKNAALILEIFLAGGRVPDLNQRWEKREKNKRKRKNKRTNNIKYRRKKGEQERKGGKGRKEYLREDKEGTKKLERKKIREGSKERQKRKETRKRKGIKGT